MKYHATLTDECGDEFGATLTAPDNVDPYEHFREQYPESRVLFIEPVNAPSRKDFFADEWRKQFEDDTQDLY